MFLNSRARSLGRACAACEQASIGHDRSADSRMADPDRHADMADAHANANRVLCRTESTAVTCATTSILDEGHLRRILEHRTARDSDR
jgi:hypothetical protein